MQPSELHLKEIAKRWPLTGELKFIRKVENWIYQSKENAVFVRVTEPSHRQKPALISELHWMDFLHEGGLVFAHPLKSEGGELVEEVSCEGETFFVSVFAEALGKPLVDKADFTQAVFYEWGRNLGKLNRLTKNYQPGPNIVPRVQWNDERAHYCILEQALPEDGAMYTKVLEIREWMNGLSKDKDSYGLIHADLHHGNFFIGENGQMMMFDFDDSQYHWFSYDLAVPIFSLKHDWQRKQVDLKWESFAESYWQGYFSENTLSDQWVKAVDRFIDYRTLAIFYWCKANLKSSDLDENSRKWMNLTFERLRSSFSNR